MPNKDVLRTLVSEEDIIKKCNELGLQIEKDYKDKDLLLLGLLKGCNPFMADLARNIDLPIELAYMVVSSYHGGTESTLDVQIKYDLEIPIRGRDILIVEDIVDTGNTITTVVELLKHRGANSVEVVTLLDKPAGRLKRFTPKYIGFTIPKEFVIGYGLDYQERYRNLRYVGILKPEIYTKESDKT